MTAFFLILLALIAAPFIAEYRRAPMTREAQEGASGRMADLSAGRTYYSLTGPSGGPVVVAIHGLSTASYMMAGTVDALTTLGFRVLTYDLYGRGFSDRVKNPQTVDFCVGQLRELLEHQKIDGPLSVVGYSMGAKIATAFAAEEGTRIRHLILIAGAGFSEKESTFFDRLSRAPLIGDWLTLVAGGWMMRRNGGDLTDVATVVPDLLDRQAAETRMRGYLPAVLSSYRHAMREPIDEDVATIAERGTPMLAIWGAADPVIPISSVGRLAELNPDAHQVQIAKAAHSVLQTHPHEVATAIRDFLTRV